MLLRLLLALLAIILNTTLVVRGQSECQDAVQVRHMVLSPDAAYLAVGDREHSLQIWDVQTGKQVNSLPLPTDYFLNSVSFSDDGKQLLLTSGNEASVWDVLSGKQTATLVHKAPTNLVDYLTGAYFVPNSKYIVTASYHEVILWDKQSGEQILSIFNNGGSEEPIDISSNGKYLLLHQQIRQDDEWQLWDIQTLQKIHTFDGAIFNGGRFTSDSKYIVYYTWESAIIQWDMEAKKEFQ
jgi:WD40 repeat protein